MGVRIFSGGVESRLSPFIGRYIENVCTAIVSSLKTPRIIGRLKIEVEKQDVRLQVDGVDVVLDRNQRFAGTLVRETLRGMVLCLKGIDEEAILRIEMDLEKR